MEVTMRDLRVVPVQSMPRRSIALLMGLAFTMLALLACGGSKEMAQTEETPLTIEPEVPSNPSPAEDVRSAPAVERAAPEPLILQTVNFDLDRYDLTPVATDILVINAKSLRAHPEAKVIIEGHCDERGTVEYNLALGDKRAKAVKDYLVSLGVDSSRLTTISYGKERPVDAGQNEGAWAKNRRAEFVRR
jgi:peptidoglycan-associated lipoprotein